MTSRAYVTYRDRDRRPYRWAELQERAAVCHETFRDRLRRGWALEDALTTPKTQKRTVVARLRTVVEQTPGICADALQAALPDVPKGGIYRALVREVEAGRIRTIKVPGLNPDGWSEVLGYVLVPANERPVRRIAEPDNWTPVPWVHPIRARALGRPVVQRHDVPELDFGNPLRSVA